MSLTQLVRHGQNNNKAGKEKMIKKKKKHSRHKIKIKIKDFTLLKLFFTLLFF